ncbi:hypothetical protein DFP72DRAFT_370011 [Ephemerocybe angulata]|uniref:Uncharacterized protein n=1 Tax=Ephemerocybe angulata TaxID=980116 RepID=A0A8H6M6Y5_9AGAR|nr:hypothetical protein DFP72DRAFT_370011 [Tulosesus angulatus]
MSPAHDTENIVPTTNTPSLALTLPSPSKPRRGDSRPVRPRTPEPPPSSYRRLNCIWVRIEVALAVVLLVDTAACCVPSCTCPKLVGDHCTTDTDYLSYTPTLQRITSTSNVQQPCPRPTEAKQGGSRRSFEWAAEKRRCDVSPEYCQYQPEQGSEWGWREW